MPIINVRPIQCSRRFLYKEVWTDGSEGVVNTSVNGAFHALWHLVEYGPQSIDFVSTTKIIVSKYPSRSSYTSITRRVDGKRQSVIAERVETTYIGDEEQMRPLVEFVRHAQRWLDGNREIEPSSGPSWLPSLCLHQIALGTRSGILGGILSSFGLSVVEIVGLTEIRWIDITVANELWFDNPDQTFMEAVQLAI